MEEYQAICMTQPSTASPLLAWFCLRFQCKVQACGAWQVTFMVYPSKEQH